MTRTPRVTAIVALAVFATTSCTNDDKFQPDYQLTATTQRAGTTKRTATTRTQPTYPPISGPDMVGTASTVPSTDAELKIPELNDAPTRIDLPCTLEHQTDGYTEALTGLTAQAPQETRINIGKRLTYRGKPAVLTRGEHGYTFAATHLDQGWIVASTAKTGQQEYILASVDPTTAQIKGDTYRVSGCHINGVSRSTTGETWISTCVIRGTTFGGGTAIRLDPAGVSFHGIVGLPNTCPKVLATADYTWLVGPGTYNDSQSTRLRLWRLNPTTREWLTVDFPNTWGETHSMIYSGNVLWQRGGTKSYCINQDPPASHGPIAVTFESLDPGGTSDRGGVRNRQMWTTTEPHRLVAFDCEGNKVADFALNDPSSVTVGEPGIFVQRPTRRDRSDIAPDANLTLSRLDPTTGQTTDLLTVPTRTVDASRSGTRFIGIPLGLDLDRTGGWILDGVNGQSPVRMPDTWFATG